jgi:hypothetical protein
VGALTLPASGLVYVDTSVVIYSVERYPAYTAVLLPLWQAAHAKRVQVVSSALCLMETLVGQRSLNQVRSSRRRQTFRATRACRRSGGLAPLQRPARRPGPG